MAINSPRRWLPPPPPPGSFQFQVSIEVLQYTPYRPGAMAELKKINLDRLWENDRMAILKKRQSIEEKKDSNKGWENSTKKKRNLKILKIIGKNF